MKIPIFTGKYHQNGGFSMAMLVSGRVLFLLLKNMFVLFLTAQKGYPFFFFAKSFAAKPAVVMSTCSSSGPSQKTCLADSKKNTTPSDIFGSKSTKHTPCSACSCLKRVFISQNKTGLPIFTITCIQFLANKKSSHRDSFWNFSSLPPFLLFFFVCSSNRIAMRWLWPVLVVALGSTHAAFHDECDNENSESCALSALQRRAHATSGGEFGASLVVKMSWLKKINE